MKILSHQFDTILSLKAANSQFLLPKIMSSSFVSVHAVFFLCSHCFLILDYFFTRKVFSDDSLTLYTWHIIGFCDLIFQSSFSPWTNLGSVLFFAYFRTGENGEVNLINLEALTGETILEKERRLSEMILQLQMVRDQLLSQQEQQAKVSPLYCLIISVILSSNYSQVVLSKSGPVAFIKSYI